MKIRLAYSISQDSLRLEISDLEEEGLYFLCSKNKGTDQPHGNRAVDLRLCFRICKNQVFSGPSQIILDKETYRSCYRHGQNKTLIKVACLSVCLCLYY